MDKSKIRKGLIVVITKYYNGNSIGSIVKTISQPGELNDKGVKLTGKTKLPAMNYTILCEAAPHNTNAPRTHNNKPTFYEIIDGLRLANVHEKQAYTKGIKHINDITEKVTEEETTNVDNLDIFI